MAGVERSAKMERTQKMLLILAIFILVLASIVEAGRKLEEKEKVDQPQNYLGGFGTSGGFIPSPNGPVFQLGPTVYCSYPGVGCVRIPGTACVKAYASSSVVSMFQEQLKWGSRGFEIHINAFSEL
ncbi:hypothetical protein OIU76_003225 [Salix suchowensis]|nr:hypothetical protein OIU76_003225 [Salix suchowensis]